MSVSWLDDLRQTLRGVGRARGFYASAVLTLAIGMAGATMIFTLVRGILLRPLPLPAEDRVVVSWRSAPDAPTHVPYRAADVEEIGRSSRGFAAVAGVGYNGAWEHVWLDGDAALTARTAVVMGELFAVLGASPVLGRPLSADDDREGVERAVVLSHAGWQRLFAGSPSVVGRRLVSGKRGFVVVGVMPPDFEYPRGVELWTSRWALAADEPNAAFRETLLRDVEIVARLKPETSLEQAAEELAATTARLDAQAPAQSYVSFRPVVRRFKDMVIGDVGRGLSILFAAVGLLLVVAGANVANLLLVRGEARRTELVVRAALGAGRGRIVQQQLVESLLVTACATLVGMAVATLGLRAVVALVPDGLPRLEAIRVDGAVVAFAMGMALVVGTLAGLAPALTASSHDLAATLRAGGRGVRGGVGQRGRRALVATQVALAVALVAAAGLLTRSLQRLQAADMGFAQDRLVLAELDVPTALEGERRRQFLDAVLDRLSAVPGIDAVTPVNSEPFAGDQGWDLPRFTAEGQSVEQVAANPSLNFEAVYPSYFSTLGVPIRRGRGFTPDDRAGAPRVAVVDEAMAARAWPGQDPIGRRLKFGGLDSKTEWLSVVGVASTTRYRELRTPRPTLYVPAEQLTITAARLVIRTSATPGLAARVVRDAVRGVDPAVRVLRTARYAEYLKRPLAAPRFNALVLLVFATSALLMSSIGLFGVMAASVRQRHAEIGVRLALGATAAGVLRMVLGEGLRLALWGALAGLALATFAAGLLRGLLFEIEPLDPVSLLGAAAALVAAALAATWLPARHATQVAPVEVLRAE
jgi:putative ABC transport system permease protein